MMIYEVWSMEMALNNERYPLWERSCPEMRDIDSINTGLLRAINVVDSGRDFYKKFKTIF